ncbi:MAG TPA: zinc ribbon domain-containing protein [Terriglobia bacterium]|nr:zinc ribbon domain-containing protein [Terriglobia bacterium]
MPIYEYACKKCGKTIEVIQKYSDPVLKKHAGCGGALTKLISASGFQFKGTGWYVTDYARKGQSSGEGSKSSSDSSKDSSGSGASAEPAAKSKPAKSSAKGSDA